MSLAAPVALVRPLLGVGDTVVSDAQVRKLMSERDKGTTIEVASLKAGMTRRTGSKYLKTGELPSDRTAMRDWRTRPDPFETDWPVVELMLEDAPELEATSLFEWLLEGVGAPRNREPAEPSRSAQARIAIDFCFPSSSIRFRIRHAVSTSTRWPSSVRALNPLPNVLLYR
jgi:hypothetical protein